MPSPNQITVSQLNRLVGTPTSPVIVDVRIDEDFSEYPDLIPSAFRHPFDDVESLAPQLTGKQVVLYCHKGKKLSQGCMALLRNKGVHAEYLQGGFMEWKNSELPLVPYKKIPIAKTRDRSLWVTKHRPKIDRIACPWLIRRFVDPRAQFLFVEPIEVMNVADRFAATPFDMEGVFWSHRQERCTFDTMIEEFGLDIEPLNILAKVVRGADTDKLDIAPQCAGLLAASLGLSRMYRDDLQQIEAGMLLYDAFFRWARDATKETHHWPSPV